MSQGVDMTEGKMGKRKMTNDHRLM